jgi:hypothetical protein
MAGGHIDVRGVLVQKEARCGRGVEGRRGGGGGVPVPRRRHELCQGGGPKDGEGEKGIVLGLGVCGRLV